MDGPKTIKPECIQIKEEHEKRKIIIKRVNFEKYEELKRKNLIKIHKEYFYFNGDLEYEGEY